MRSSDELHKTCGQVTNYISSCVRPRECTGAPGWAPRLKNGLVPGSATLCVAATCTRTPLPILEVGQLIKMKHCESNTV
eukprot:SAG31_NODE_240_length_19407_cov_29.686140_20_plen_79_part_00